MTETEIDISKKTGEQQTGRWVRIVPDGILLEHGELSGPAPGEAMVRTLLAGICGSDLHAMKERHPFVPLPYRPGHEILGVVEELGGDADDAPSAGLVAKSGPERLHAGDRVVVEPTIYCGQCKQCRRGAVNLCEHLAFFGTVYPTGGMADRFVLPTNRLHVVPTALSNEQAVLIEPLSTAVHAVGLVPNPTEGADPDLSGRTTVVIGAGTIGLLVLQVARWAGAARIVVTDLLQDKRRRALAFGADAVVDAGQGGVVEQVLAELGESADVVFDCVSTQSTVEQALTMALKGGTVVVIGVPANPVSVDLALLQDRQIRIQGSAIYLPADFATAIRLLADGLVSVEDIVTLTLPLDDVEAAFAAAGSGEHVKVLVRP
jgi:2-desacetyl-2-hydroxyethyl bacteriochlorophyllide A dehydrogenase